MMRTDSWPSIILLFGIALTGSVADCSLANPVAAWKDIFPSLYYIPIVVAAINLGMRAAVSVALVSGTCYAVASAAGCGFPWIRPFAETILFVCVGITAAKVTRIHERLVAGKQARSKEAGDFNIENAFHGAPGTQQVPGFGQIVAGLIRRFRTPLSSIEGAVWLLEDTRFPDDKRGEFIRIIRKEAHQLDTALSDILQFTQPRSPRPRKVNLSQLLDEVIELAGPKDHRHFLLFRKDIPAALPLLSCDPEMISKVLLNLARNAIQATPAGGQIIFAAHVEPDNVVISVKDHGGGIPDLIVDRIFDPFFTTRESGLGLGLTVARQIVAAHRGTIAVDNLPEKGTSVSVVLPLHPPYRHEYGPHTDS